MAPLKENLKYHLKKHHMGKENAVTIRDLAIEFFILRATTTEIRRALMELLLEGSPIMMFPEIKVYFSKSDEELEGLWNKEVGSICF